jgi:ferritin-like metal-binding protein YciE
MSEAKNPDVLDAGLIGCAQAVEHYEIARYGTLVAWAEQLKLANAVALLEETLMEEKATDEKLSELAYGGVNKDAHEEDQADDEDDEEDEDQDDKPKRRAKAKS